VLQHPVCLLPQQYAVPVESRTFSALLESTVFIILHLVVVYLHLMHNVRSRGAFNKQICAEREGQNKGTEMLFVFYIVSQGPQNKKI